MSRLTNLFNECGILDLCTANSDGSMSVLLIVGMVIVKGISLLSISNIRMLSRSNFKLAVK